MREPILLGFPGTEQLDGSDIMMLGGKIMEITAKSLALDTLEGMANSYLRRRKEGTTLNRVSGQENRARNCGASDEQISARIKKAIADTHTAATPRASELQRFIK